MKRPTVFLDRDGVLNRAIVTDGKPLAPTRIEDLEILTGVPEALARLKDAGYDLIVVTNQPDVSRGLMPRAVVDAMHAHLALVLPLDEIRVCLHDDADDCPCRKPKPGLLLEPPTADVSRSVLIGDRWRDIDAGRAAGCRATVLIDYHYAETVPHEPDVRVASLGEAADWILTHMGDA